MIVMSSAVARFTASVSSGVSFSVISPVSTDSSTVSSIVSAANADPAPEKTVLQLIANARIPAKNLLFFFVLIYLSFS